MNETSFEGNIFFLIFIELTLVKTSSQLYGRGGH